MHQLFTLVQLLLGSQVARVTALPLSAVAGLGRVRRVALSADLLAVHFLLDERNERGVHLPVARATSQAQHEMQRALLLDVVVGERAAVLELLAREDERPSLLS